MELALHLHALPPKTFVRRKVFAFSTKTLLSMSGEKEDIPVENISNKNTLKHEMHGLELWEEHAWQHTPRCTLYPLHIVVLTHLFLPVPSRDSSFFLCPSSLSLTSQIYLGSEHLPSAVRDARSPKSPCGNMPCFLPVLPLGRHGIFGPSIFITKIFGHAFYGPPG